MNRRREFSTLSSYLQSNIPIFVPSFNNPTYLRNMLSQLMRRGLANIVVIDNASSFQPMLDYLKSISGDVTVIFQNENRGPRDLFLDVSLFDSLPDIFCLTDPDLALNENLPDDFLVQLLKVTHDYRIFKAGFAIDRSTLLEPGVRVDDPAHFHQWEEQFWQAKVGVTPGDDDIYRANIDTTFALYNKRYLDIRRRDSLFRRLVGLSKPEKRRHLDSMRVAGRFTCKHLPWTSQDMVPDDERNFYKSRQKWSHSLM